MRTKRCAWVLSLISLSWAAIAGSVNATTVQPDEMAELRRWVAAKFEGQGEQPDRRPGYIVLANNDPVQRNARGGQLLDLQGKKFSKGLYCHAPSKLIVRLPGPGGKFQAVVGVDSNEQTRPGRGSVVFSVQAGGQERFRSPVTREGMAGQAVEVDLGGASEFILEVTDGGDGMGCDQSDWADAQVALQDGTTVWLGDLPEISDARRYSIELPFTFKLAGQPFRELVKPDAIRRQRRELDQQRTEHELTWRDEPTGLEVRCVAIEYRDFPTVEWTLHLKNTGSSDSPLIEEVRSLDGTFVRGTTGEFQLHYQTGSPCKPTDYEPFVTSLKPGTNKRLAPLAGRGTDPWLPYFNLEFGGDGLIVVVGWPGQWSAEFVRDTGCGVTIRAGQEATRFRLRPGETVRSPLMVLQFYRGDWVRAQNVWRRWMLAHNLPRPGGQLPPAQLAACSSHQFGEMINANEENQKLFVDRYLAEGLKLDYWWMDAGWYVNRSGWPDVGTWEVDAQRFPRGLRAITEHARARGVRSIVWFEPERVSGGTWIAEQHPEWVQGGKAGGLLDLGNDQARTWLTEHVDKLLVDQGIDLYRQDFNMDPLDFWRRADSEDRQGLTENRHVVGYLAYWDELRRRHPDMLIDSCASGGRRNDLETLRRAVPLLRSDYILEPLGQQQHTYGIAFWMPFHGTGINAFDAYTFRSQMGPHLTACYDMRRTDLPFDDLRRLYQQWLQIKDLYFGDYYPLTAYSTERDVWMAWQFDKPEEGRGLIQAFRRPESVYELARFRLRGLDPQANYAVQDFDAPEKNQEISGRELIERGLSVTIEEQPGSRVLVYQKK